MGAFLEQYGIAIFIIIILGIMTLMANGLGLEIKKQMSQEINKFTQMSVQENQKALDGSEDKLNEYGFYYDKPYRFAALSIGENNYAIEESLTFSENGTVKWSHDNEVTLTLTASYAKDIITLNFVYGTETYPIEILILNNGTCISSEDFIYGILDDPIIKDGDYTYALYEKGGWHVIVNDRTKSSYDEIKSEINGIKVISLDSTFYNCTSLTNAPIIPETIETMHSTFDQCTSLISAPIIPSKVETLAGTFDECTSLTGNVEINTNPINYDNCFIRTTKPITITGSCSDETKAALAATANNGNVSY